MALPYMPPQTDPQSTTPGRFSAVRTGSPMECVGFVGHLPHHCGTHRSFWATYGYLWHRQRHGTVALSATLSAGLLSVRLVQTGRDSTYAHIAKANTKIHNLHRNLSAKTTRWAVFGLTKASQGDSELSPPGLLNQLDVIQKERGVLHLAAWLIPQT